MNIGNRRRKKELARELAELQAAHEHDKGELLWRRAVFNPDNTDKTISDLEAKLAGYEQRMAQIEAELADPAYRPAVPGQPEPRLQPPPPAVLNVAGGNSLAVRLLEITVTSRLRFPELPDDLDYQVAEVLDRIAPVMNGGTFPVALLRRVKYFEREFGSSQPTPEFFEEMRGLPAELLVMARQYARVDSL